jgi:hypothetical protein
MYIVVVVRYVEVCPIHSCSCTGVGCDTPECLV